MITLRQYSTPDKVSEITGIPQGELSLNLLNQAESMIDSIIANFDGYTYLGRSIKHKSTFEDKLLTQEYASLPAFVYYKDYFKYCQLHIFTGKYAGKVLPITGSDQITGAARVFYPKLQEEVYNEVCSFQIYQLGKFPTVRDTVITHNQTYKFIPDDIQEAVAWQVAYILQDPNGIFSSGSGLKSESIGENYSYTRGSVSDGSFDIRHKIHPKALQILNFYMHQSY